MCVFITFFKKSYLKKFYSIAIANSSSVSLSAVVVNVVGCGASAATQLKSLKSPVSTSDSISSSVDWTCNFFLQLFPLFFFALGMKFKQAKDEKIGCRY